jgi:hypothetical protein
VARREEERAAGGGDLAVRILLAVLVAGMAVKMGLFERVVG